MSDAVVSLKLVAILGLAFALCSCANTPVSWQGTLPPVDYFRTHWANDAANQQIQPEGEYLLWIQRFYEGFNTAPGWFELQTQVLGRVAPDEQADIAEQLNSLGRTISAEWAKDNSVRRIHTSTVATWRDALQESISRMELSSYLMRLTQDITALLDGSLTSDEITFERYYTDEFDF